MPVDAVRLDAFYDALGLQRGPRGSGRRASRWSLESSGGARTQCCQRDRGHLRFLPQDVKDGPCPLAAEGIRSCGNLRKFPEFPNSSGASTWCFLKSILPLKFFKYSLFIL